MNNKLTSIFLLLVIFIYPLYAEAYIDPGTGSLIIQAIIAGFFGVIMYAKISWAKIKNFFYPDNHFVDDDKNKQDEIKEIGDSKR